MNIEVYFDGGANPNPGRAYGSFEVVFDGQLELGLSRFMAKRIQLGDGIGNNQAEYMTMIRALKWVSRFLMFPGHAKVTVYSDSKLVVEQMSHRWKAHDPKIKALRAQASELCCKFLDVRFIWEGRSNNVERFGH
jgi:ribonuclease HI